MFQSFVTSKMSMMKLASQPQALGSPEGVEQKGLVVIIILYACACACAKLLQYKNKLLSSPVY